MQQPQPRIQASPETLFSRIPSNTSFIGVVHDGFYQLYVDVAQVIQEEVVDGLHGLAELVLR